MKMKKTKILGLVLALIMFFTNLPFGSGIVRAEAGDVEINESNFPDKKFKDYVRANYDNEFISKGYLRQGELDAVRTIDLTDIKYDRISSLKGIEHFKNLKVLRLNSSVITNINLSSNKALWILNIKCERLSDLTLGALDNLEDLSCDYAQIASLNLSECKNLKSIKFARVEKLADLDVSGCKNLEKLWVANSIFETIDLSNNTNLKNLNLFTGKLKKIDLRNNTKLTNLLLKGNN